MSVSRRAGPKAGATQPVSAALLVTLGLLVWSHPALAQRIPGQSARQSSLQGIVRDEDGRGIPGVEIELRQRAASGRPTAFGDTRRTTTSADGVFRFLELPAGEYSLALTHPGFEPLAAETLRIGRSELVTTELTMKRAGVVPPAAAPTPVEPVSPYGRVVRPRPDAATEPVPGGRGIGSVPLRQVVRDPAARVQRVTVEGVLELKLVPCLGLRIDHLATTRCVGHRAPLP